jgi:hypothetical protein
MNLNDYVHAHVEEVVRRRAAAIERACEEAVQGGEFGVLVDDEDGWARTDASVPYGQIFVLPMRSLKVSRW